MSGWNDQLAAKRQEALAQWHETRAEDMRFMYDTGESATRAAARLGISLPALEQWCRRHGFREVFRVMRVRDGIDLRPVRDREGQAS